MLPNFHIWISKFNLQKEIETGVAWFPNIWNTFNSYDLSDFFISCWLLRYLCIAYCKLMQVCYVRCPNQTNVKQLQAVCWLNNGCHMWNADGMQCFTNCSEKWISISGEQGHEIQNGALYSQAHCWSASLLWKMTLKLSNNGLRWENWRICNGKLLSLNATYCELRAIL